MEQLLCRCKNQVLTADSQSPFPQCSATQWIITLVTWLYIQKTRMASMSSGLMNSICRYRVCNMVKASFLCQIVLCMISCKGETHLSALKQSVGKLTMRPILLRMSEQQQKVSLLLVLRGFTLLEFLDTIHQNG